MFETALVALGPCPGGVLLIAGGVLSFLPVPGLWVIPLGLLLLTQGLAILQRPTRRALVCRSGVGLPRIDAISEIATAALKGGGRQTGRPADSRLVA